MPRFDLDVLLGVIASGLWVILSLVGCVHIQPRTQVDFPALGARNAHGLVSPHWVKALLDYHQSNFQTRRPDTYENKRFVILEASWGKTEDAKDYRNGHLPGAIHGNTDDFENGYPMWRLKALPDLHQAIGNYGITPDTTVIVYGKELIAAARVWWILKYAGVTDVRLLDGGVKAWETAGYPVEKEIQTPQPVAFSGRASSHWLATTSYVRQHHRNHANVVLADVRSAAEFSGRVSGYDYLDRKGRIPGAVHCGDANDASYLYKKRDGTLRSPADILAMWRERGIVSTIDDSRFDREVIFYCGGGWRSSVAIFYAWLMGYENVRNYSDGWGGWSTNYVRDPEARKGWRQESTGNPILIEAKNE